MQSLRVAGMIILAVAGGAHPGFGQQYYFSNSGGTQVWNSASANWSAASGGPYDTTWAGGDAIFEGTAGTVVVDSVFANSLTFTLTGYKLTGGSLTLTGPTNTVMAGSVTNAATLSGTAGLVKTGSGTLVLAATTNLYSGGTIVEGGTLQINSDGQLSAAGESLTLAGGTFRNISPLNTTYRPLTLGAGGRHDQPRVLSQLQRSDYRWGRTLCQRQRFHFNAAFRQRHRNDYDVRFAPLHQQSECDGQQHVHPPHQYGAACISKFAPTSFTNPVTFVSGCGFCARIGNITLNTTNCAFPSSGSFTFNVDDAYTFPVQVERASRVSSTCKGSSPVPERSRNGTRIRC